MSKPEISSALVTCLLRDQFPQWSDLPISTVELDGWDNTTFRLGDTMAVRLPSADAYAAQVDKEHLWLPVLAEHLPLLIPRPLARGVPGCGFPRPWSIYSWLEGDPASIEGITDLADFAIDLAKFLGALYLVDAAGGPSPGKHNFFRGGPLATYDTETRTTIDDLTDEIDTGAATQTWEGALSEKWNGRPVWIHGDVAPANLLVVDGRLNAVIDFGCSAVGDPACDTVIAWTFFSGRSREAFRDTLPVDEGTWARGKGWALWKALITLAEALRSGSHTADSAGLRFGWKHNARSVIDEVLAEY